MSGNIGKASRRKMKRHDKLVQALPGKLRELNRKMRQLTSAFADIHKGTERASELSFAHAVAGVGGEHAGSIKAKHLSEHLAAIIEHADNISASTRGARHLLATSEIKANHKNLQDICSDVRQARELVTGVHNDLAELHSNLVLLREMYEPD